MDPHDEDHTGEEDEAATVWVQLLELNERHRLPAQTQDDGGHVLNGAQLSNIFVSLAFNDMMRRFEHPEPSHAGHAAHAAQIWNDISSLAFNDRMRRLGAEDRQVSNKSDWTAFVKCKKIFIVEGTNNSIASVQSNTDPHRSAETTSSLSALEKGKQKQIEAEEDECPICREVYDIASHAATRTVCGHMMGWECLAIWTFDEKHYTCPMCRGDLFKEVPDC